MPSIGEQNYMGLGHQKAREPRLSSRFFHVIHTSSSIPYFFFWSPSSHTIPPVFGCWVLGYTAVSKPSTDLNTQHGNQSTPTQDCAWKYSTSRSLFFFTISSFSGYSIVIDWVLMVISTIATWGLMTHAPAPDVKVVSICSSHAHGLKVSGHISALILRLWLTLSNCGLATLSLSQTKRLGQLY